MAPSTARDWYDVGGGESGYIAPEPNDPNIVYAGSYGGEISRYDHRTHQQQAVNPWPINPIGWGAADLKHRFQWTEPIVFSPHDPKTLYYAGEVLFKTTDGGMSWTIISPDLTRNDKSKQAVIRRTDHQGQHRRRGLRHHLFGGGIARAEGPDLGR